MGSQGREEEWGPQPLGSNRKVTARRAREPFRVRVARSADFPRGHPLCVEGAVVPLARLRMYSAVAVKDALGRSWPARIVKVRSAVSTLCVASTLCFEYAVLRVRCGVNTRCCDHAVL